MLSSRNRNDCTATRYRSAGLSIVYSFEDKFVLVTPIGFNTYEDISKAFEDIIADPAFHRPAIVLFDARQTDYGPPR